MPHFPHIEDRPMPKKDECKVAITSETLRAARAQEAEFLKAVAPTVRRAAAWTFRTLPAELREEKEQDALAWAWRHFVGLVARGTTAGPLAGMIAAHCIKLVAAGRHVQGSEPIREPLARRCQRRHGVRVRPLPSAPSEVADVGTDPAEAAAFRLDFAAWRDQWDTLRRAVIDDLAAGFLTVEVAARCGRSFERIRQLREELRRSWEQKMGA
jgi:hypothetical protein